MFDYDLIIIGCGPAGMNACLYATRAKLKTLVIERNYPGGKVVKAESIENWLGTEQINGVDLSLQMFKHAFSYGGVYEQGNVLDIIDNEEGYKEVVLKDKSYKCKAVIIAIGTSEKKIGIPGEEKFYGKGVSYCAVCDAPLYKDKTIVVIGDSESSLEEAIYLSKFVKKIYYINKNLDIELTLLEKTKKIESIEFLLNVSPHEIVGDNVVKGLIVINNNKKEYIETSAIFLFLGDNPDTKFIEKMNIVDENKYIIVNEKKETKIEGIYAVGDCTNTRLKQIVTASGDGALAAMEVYKYIKTNKI